jgi:hypothetical protein
VPKFNRTNYLDLKYANNIQLDHAVFNEKYLVEFEEKAICIQTKII